MRGKIWCSQMRDNIIHKLKYCVGQNGPNIRIGTSPQFFQTEMNGPLDMCTASLRFQWTHIFSFLVQQSQLFFTVIDDQYDYSVIVKLLTYLMVSKAFEQSSHGFFRRSSERLVGRAQCCKEMERNYLGNIGINFAEWLSGRPHYNSAWRGFLPFWRMPSKYLLSRLLWYKHSSGNIQVLSIIL